MSFIYKISFIVWLCISPAEFAPRYVLNNYRSLTGQFEFELSGRGIICWYLITFFIHF